MSILIAIKKDCSEKAVNGFEKVFEELPKNVTAEEYEALYNIYSNLLLQNTRNEKDK